MTESGQPTEEQLTDARRRAAALGLTIRGRKHYKLDDGKEEPQECGDFGGLLWWLDWRETIERGEPTTILSPCGSHGTEFRNDAEQTSFMVERQEDGNYKKTSGSKTDLETGESIQFDVLEDGSHKETHRFPKEDDEDESDDKDGTGFPLLPTLVSGLVRRVKALIEKADRAADKAEQLYKSAGLTIKEIKDKCPNDWESIVGDQCGIGRSRSYELMAIADGRTTLEKVRASANDRKKIHRAKSESVPERTEPTAADRAEARCAAQPRATASQCGSESTAEGDEASDADHEEGLRVIAVRGFMNRATEAAGLAHPGRLQAEDITEAMIRAAERAATAWNAVAHKLRGSHDDPVEQCLSLFAAMTKEQRDQFFAKYTEVSQRKLEANAL